MSEIEVYVFQCVEALAALELVDVAIVIDIQLVSAQNGHGGDFAEGEVQHVRTTFIDDDPVAVKADGGLFSQQELVFVDYNFGQGGLIPEYRLTDHLGQVQAVHEALLIIVPVGHEGEGEVKSHTGKLLVRALEDRPAAALAGNLMPMALEFREPTVWTNIDCSFQILRPFFRIKICVSDCFIYH